MGGQGLKFQDEVEIAQARYSLNDQSGILSLNGFPTSQLAEEYFERLYSVVNFKSDTGQRLYFKRARTAARSRERPSPRSAAV